MQRFWGVRGLDDALAYRVDLEAPFTGGQNPEDYDEAYFHLTDVNGSSIALIDATGALVERVVYDAYGRGRHRRANDIDADGTTTLATDRAFVADPLNQVAITDPGYNPDAIDAMNALDFGYAIAALLTAPWWMRKARGGWPERFGRTGPIDPPAPDRPRVLVHAVSVGEVSALRTLAPLLAPTVDLVISATTDTGLARARDLFEKPGVARVVRFPLDFTPAVDRFLEAVRPDAAVLVELELWPNFMSRCRRRGIPVGVINGRLSERSFRGYRRFRPLVRGMFESLAFAAVQDEDYAARFIAMGAPTPRVQVTGSMKWDAASVLPPAGAAELLARELGIDRSRPLIVAGSTGPGEERLLHESCPPGAQLLCAPRRPERFDEAAQALEGCVRRSRPGVGNSATGRFLLDTIGELRAAYALADVVVVGRSFGAQHGSDPMEPAALGKPVVIGPRFGDFASVVRAMQAGDAIVIAEPGDLPGVLAGLLASADRRADLAARALACVRGRQGASRRHADLIAAMVQRPNVSAGLVDGV